MKKIRHPYAWSIVALLGASALVSVGFRALGNFGSAVQTPIEGHTIYPNGAGGPTRWTLFYNPAIDGRWEFRHSVATAAGEQTRSYSPKEFLALYSKDGKPLQDVDIRGFVTYMAKKDVPAYDLAALEVQLNGPTTKEAIKQLTGRGTIVR